MPITGHISRFLPSYGLQGHRKIVQFAQKVKNQNMGH